MSPEGLASITRWTYSSQGCCSFRATRDRAGDSAVIANMKSYGL